ncbi:hypothetical protein Rhal01_01377 [Rubritalea halochordaticola]|uniref:NodB homology domain-containing protein n=1 Tax=Rubritalea halochordaticola TaxID=714537 RepID=A0ABP9V3J0_9BACT
MNGIFTISLDFELYWGIRDKKNLATYRQNLDGVCSAVEGLLALFQKYEVHATWATVGFMFADRLDDVLLPSENKIPSYSDQNLCPYRYIKECRAIDHIYHFAPDLISKIAKVKGQEVASHTYSHYYCLEPGQNVEQFREDTRLACNIAEKNGYQLKSLVFPRNQFNESYLKVLKDCGITSYRGNERSWMYKASSGLEQGLIKRTARLLDSYVPISGNHSYFLSDLGVQSPRDIPASRFLRPYSSKLKALEGLRLRRICRELKEAAKLGKVYHLWWHPHNFGVDLDQNLNFLEEILNVYSTMSEIHGMQSLNMKEINEIIG